MEMPYATVRATLARILGFTESVHTLERNQREMAAAVADFWKDRPTPAAEQSAIKKERGPSWHGEQVRNLQY